MELGINDSKGNMSEGTITEDIITEGNMTEGTITELNNYYKACVEANSDNKKRINEISRQTGLREPPPYLKESGYVLSLTDYTEISQNKNNGLVERIFSLFKMKKGGRVRDLSIGRSNLSLLSNTRIRKLYSKYHKTNHKIKKMKHKSRTTRKYRKSRKSKTTRRCRTARKYRTSRTSRN